MNTRLAVAAALIGALSLTGCGNDGIKADVYTIGYDDGTATKIDPGSYTTTAKSDQECTYWVTQPPVGQPASAAFDPSQQSTYNSPKRVDGTVTADFKEPLPDTPTVVKLTGPCVWTRVGS